MPRIHRPCSAPTIRCYKGTAAPLLLTKSRQSPPLQWHWRPKRALTLPHNRPSVGLSLVCPRPPSATCRHSTLNRLIFAARRVSFLPAGHTAVPFVFHSSDTTSRAICAELYFALCLTSILHHSLLPKPPPFAPTLRSYCLRILLPYQNHIPSFLQHCRNLLGRDIDAPAPRIAILSIPTRQHSYLPRFHLASHPVDRIIALMLSSTSRTS